MSVSVSLSERLNTATGRTDKVIVKVFVRNIKKIKLRVLGPFRSALILILGRTEITTSSLSRGAEGRRDADNAVEKLVS